MVRGNSNKDDKKPITGQNVEAGSSGQNRKRRGEEKGQMGWRPGQGETKWRETEMKMELTQVAWTSHK